jgi:energy-coupling factor transport system substrate-specific component
MFTAGWVGMSTPVLRPLVKALSPHRGNSKPPSMTDELLILGLFGLVWGFMYGAIMNLWQWPFIAGPLDQSYMAGAGIKVTLQHYLAFYLVTSLVWDAAAGLGNVLLIFAFGMPTLRALRRFKQRFEFSYAPDGSAIAEQQEGSVIK